LSTYSPLLEEHYVETMAKLLKRHPKLRFPYPGRSIFAHTSFNFGPDAVTYAHADTQNLAYGMCSILSLGDYNSKMGGHIVFHSLRLAVEFPPNTICLVMSAAIVHCNIRIQDGEHRASITQYTNGGLFRWVQNNCKPSPPVSAAVARKEGQRWWMESRKYLSTTDSLWDDLKGVQQRRNEAKVQQ
ncbi:hypothetical protein OF83DRAFT_1069088, partial [Amylostereum chailletii]